MLPLVVPDLTTARLLLRPLAFGDVEAVHAWQSDPEVVRYLPYAPRTTAEVADFVRRFAGARHLRADGDRVVLAIVPGPADADLGTPGDTPIGELHVVLRSAVVREFELGWVLGGAAHGRGVASEAARAVLDLLFAAGAHRIRAELDPRNAASAALCARLGMVQEAHHRQDFRDGDTWADTAIWAMVDSDPRP